VANAGSKARPPKTVASRLRALPSVERLLQTEPLRTAAAGAPRALAVSVARAEIERRRSEIADGDGDVPEAQELAESAVFELERLARPSLRRLINATGVVIHTNLGRAPLAREAIEAVDATAAGYSNLEYDLDAGERGSRQEHVEGLLRELTGAEAALAVNNNAAAVVLALAALAHGREVVISRGQLVEIGGSFRIPDILAASGAALVEVGTTNRTRVEDYAAAIGPDAAVLMRVHASNFRTIGFVEEVGIEALAVLGRQRSLFVVDDLGSGVLAGGEFAALADEPAARESLAAGADVVCFSGDKLLGGPQAGLVVGGRRPVELMRKHPLARAVRIDKLSLAALEATLRIHRDPQRAIRELPVSAMLDMPESKLADRAERLRAGLQDAQGASVTIERGAGRAGGGALPLLELEGPVVAIRPIDLGVDALHARLRGGDPPVVARIHEGALILDPRTIAADELDLAATAVAAALEPN
jgi:L-seryl-tRNA(Ser) seleniumtransferase